MTYKLLAPVLCAGFAGIILPAFADDDVRIDPSQLRIISDHEARKGLGASVNLGTKGNAAATGTLPTWAYQVTATQNNTSYSGAIVGGSPSAGGSTAISVVLIPVIFKITQNGVTYTFDPTQGDTGCLGSGNTGFGLTGASPLFNANTFSIDGTSISADGFGDAVLKGEFYNGGGSSSSYHLQLNVTTGAAMTITMNVRRGNSTGEVYGLGGTQCGTGTTTNPHAKIAVVNINTVDAALQSYITAHGLNASQFPFFVTYNTVMSVGAANNLANCCVLGYHNALGSPGQTYGIAEFEGRNQTVFSGVADVAAASHELNEWINDPSGVNPTPPWGNIGQVSGCQSNFEVGDPLSGSLMPAFPGSNGFTYHLQEEAFFSWFYGGTGLAAGGRDSSNGTFAGAAKLCPPGGTN
jgi:hypothetical protein